MSSKWNEWDGLVADEKFRLIRYLGGSAHSAVYLTESSGAEGKRAAIKFLHTDPARADLQLARWRLASKLVHPGIQPILEFGRCQFEGQDLLYVVMELAEEDLSQILPQRALTPEEAKEMLRQVLDALSFLHERKFVHTRIKPSNILALGEKVKISADQICPAGEGMMPLEAKSLYGAPEDVAGVAVPSSDIWSLGVTLAEVLTQHHPSWRQSPTGELKLAEELPSPFQEIASHALVRETSRRWNAKDIKADLEAPRGKPLAEWRGNEAPVSREPAKPPKRREPETRRVPPQREAANRGLPFSPMWILVPGIMGGALLVAWISLSHSVPHRPAEEPAASSAAAEANTQAATSSTPAAKEVSSKASKERGHALKESATPRASEDGELKSARRTPEKTKDSKLTGDQGQILDQVMPDVSEKALNTIYGAVRVSVRVQVDASGKVTQAEFDSAGPSKYFADKALEAARRWEFIPPDKEGRGAPSEWILRFDFRKSGAKAYAKKTSP
jgi:TonB family protein